MLSSRRFLLCFEIMIASTIVALNPFCEQPFTSKLSLYDVHLHIDAVVGAVRTRAGGVSTDRMTRLTPEKRTPRLTKEVVYHTRYAAHILLQVASPRGHRSKPVHDDTTPRSLPAGRPTNETTRPPRLHRFRC